jgi:predicted MFS family arabinose efflux permease
LLADYFPPRERSLAFGIYTLGIPIGGALGLAIGGFLNDYFGWRAAFFVVGLPGLLLALIIAFALKEPPRGLSENRQQAAGAKPPPLGEVVRALWERKTFHHLCAAFALTAFAGYGTQQWYPTYFIRTFHLSTGVVGPVIALATGVAGGISALLGGYLADKFSAHDRRWICWLPGFALLCTIPFTVLVLLQPTFSSAIKFLVIGSLFSSVHLGPIFGVAQTIVPLRMRALAASVLLFATNLVGIGLGPQTVGILSDVLHGMGIDTQSGLGAVNSLRIAIGFNTVVTLWAVLHYFLAARTLRADIAREQ